MLKIDECQILYFLVMIHTHSWKTINQFLNSFLGDINTSAIQLNMLQKKE